MFMAPSYSYKLTKIYKPTDFNTSNFHSLMLGGSKISDDQMMAVKHLFPHTFVCSVYGMTEINGCITFYDQIRDKEFIETKFASSGRPTPGFTYKVRKAIILNKYIIIVFLVYRRRIRKTCRI